MIRMLVLAASDQYRGDEPQFVTREMTRNFSVRNTLASCSSIASFIFTNQVAILGKAFLFTMNVQATSYFSITPPPSAHLVSTTTLLVLQNLWMKTYALETQPTFFETLDEAGITGANSLTITLDEGILVAGAIKNPNAENFDVLLAKCWTNGTLAWAKTLGGPNDDEASSITTTSDGEILLAGYTNSSGVGYYDAFLIKLWANGTLVWAKTLGGWSDDKALTLTIMPDSGILVAGVTGSSGAGSWDIFITKWWNNGDLDWAKTLGGINPDLINSVAITSDGGIVLAGYTGSYEDRLWNVLLVKCWTDGTFAWAKKMNVNDYDFAYSLTTTSDGGIVATGLSLNFDTLEQDLLLAKWWTNGTLAWAKTLGEANTYQPMAKALTTTPDGGLIAAGSTYTTRTGSYDVLLTKWWGNGTFIWAKTSVIEGPDGAEAIMTTPDGSIVTAGFHAQTLGGRSSVALLAKLTMEGQLDQCDLFRNIGMRAVDITAWVNITNPSVLNRNWNHPVIHNWSDVSKNTISPTLNMKCSEVTVTDSKTTPSNLKLVFALAFGLGTTATAAAVVAGYVLWSRNKKTNNRAKIYPAEQPSNFEMSEKVPLFQSQEKAAPQTFNDLL